MNSAASTIDLTITNNLVCAGDYMDGDGNDFDDKDACQVRKNRPVAG